MRPGTGSAFIDGVAAQVLRAGKGVRVVPVPAGHQIVARAADQRIIARSAQQRVVAVAADQGRIAVEQGGVQQVGAIAADQRGRCARRSAGPPAHRQWSPRPVR